MDVSKIVKEAINKYISEECKMLKEFKNPKDAETVRVCGDMLQNLHDSLVENGVSKREVTVVTMNKIIGELRHLEEMMMM